MQYLPDRERYVSMSTEALRASFLAGGLFKRDEVSLRFYDLDRVIVGGGVPVDRPLRLEPVEALSAAYFAERREIGLLNIGGSGAVVVDGARFLLGRRDGLYVGRGSREIVLESEGVAEPARFYIVSYPAHASFPTCRILAEDVEPVELGSAERGSRRLLYKYVHPEGISSAQLVMGITDIAPGSVWNTMPAHTHERRSEVYMYFDLGPDDVVVHLMGAPSETRSLVVRNEEAVLSPPWSVHAGAGTTRYTFCWAMGGENQDFGDMQMVRMGNLR